MRRRRGTSSPTYVPPDRDARIVDLGCGDGVLLHFLLEAGYRHVSGIDVSDEQIARAHGLGLFEARRGDIDTFLASADDRSLDVVLLIDVLEHLTREELFAVLDGVARVLSPGGVCIAHVPNAEGLYGMRVRYGDLTHEQAFTARSMSQAFATVGFQSTATRSRIGRSSTACAAWCGVRCGKPARSRIACCWPPKPARGVRFSRRTWS